MKPTALALLTLGLAACDPPRATAPPPPPPPATSSAPPTAADEPEPTPSFASLEYVLTYRAMPPASAALVLQGNGDATLRFDGNQDSRLVPQGPAGNHAGRVSPGRRRKLEDALRLAAVTGSEPMPATPGPIATGRLTLRRADGSAVAVEFPLDGTPPRWRPLRHALAAVVVELLAK